MIEWFDCCAEIGRRSVPSPLQAPDAAGLAAVYGEIGIGRALVAHAMLTEMNSAAGNARALAALDGYPQLAPAWSILPPQTEEMGTVTEFLAAMRAARVRALWAIPDGYLLNMLTFGPLFEELAARRIPLFLRVANLGGWDPLTRLLAEAPAGLRLAVVLPGVWGQERFFRPLIERYRNLHLITSLFMVAGAFRSHADRYGVDQLLFGTDFPYTQPGGTMLMLRHSGLADAQIAAIAGGNLRRLLEEVRL